MVWYVTLSVFSFVIDNIHSSTLKFMLGDLFKYVILTDMKDNYCVISDLPVCNIS